MYGGYGCFSLKITPGWLQPHPFLQDLPIPGQHPSLFCCPWLQTRIISWWQWLLLWLAGSFLSTPMCFLFFCAFSFRCPCKSVSTPEGIFLKPYFLNSEVSNTISFLQILGGGGKCIYFFTTENYFFLNGHSSSASQSLSQSQEARTGSRLVGSLPNILPSHPPPHCPGPYTTVLTNGIE